MHYILPMTPTSTGRYNKTNWQAGPRLPLSYRVFEIDDPAADVVSAGRSPPQSKL